MEKYGTDQLPFDAYESLPKTRAALVEALRMYPAGNILIRESTEDSVLQIPHTNGDGSKEEKSMHIPKGTPIIIDMIGMRKYPLHYVANLEIN
jgi:hypothetical protein